MNDKLKACFENNFPEQANMLGNLSTLEEKEEYTNELLTKVHADLNSSLAKL